MSKLQKLMIGTKEVNEKKNFIWNMAGSTIFAAASMLLSFFMIHILGENQGGIFSIAITISQMMAFIAYYETRTYQVTDVEHRFAFGEYKAVKLLLCVIMMVVCAVYMFCREGGFGLKTIVILLMCVYRMIDGYADLYEGTFQSDGRLDLTGKSQAFRTLLSAGVLAAGVLCTGNMLLSILMAIAAAVVGLLLFDVLVMREFRDIRPAFSKKAIIGILKECFPLFVSSFLWTYLLSASRMAIDSNMTSNFQSYFQVLFLPVSVINLCATFIMKPVLPRMAESYNDRNTKDFMKLILRIAFLIGAFTVICMVGAYLLGIPVLSVLSGCDLKEYRGVLVFLMAAGGVNSLSYMMYYVLTSMRCTSSILISYLSASALAAVISGRMVRRGGIMGASWSFFFAVTFLLFMFLLFFAIQVHRDWKIKEDA